MTTLREYWDGEERGRFEARALAQYGPGGRTVCDDWPDDIVCQPPGYAEGWDAELTRLAAAEPERDR